MRTVCLEFFGNAKDAVPRIVEIKDYLFDLAAKSAPASACCSPASSTWTTATCKAVGYATKSKRGGLPKMVLFGDIVGDDADAVARATSEVVRIANARARRGLRRRQRRGAQEVLARPQAHRGDQQAHQRLQDQRGRGDPAAAHGRVHRRHRAHQHRAAACATSWRWSIALEAFFASGNLPLGKSDDAGEIAAAELLEDRVQQALALLREVGALVAAAGSTEPATVGARRRPTPAAAVFALLQDHTLRASWKTQIRAPLRAIFAGAAFAADRRRVPERSTSEVLHGRVWVALHMHAGDGNVHTNIPVNSDNYEMLQTAHAAVARIMELARSLDGVISGEHGIGITKLEFLTDDELAAFTDYKQRVDPEGPLQQGQAAARRVVRRRRRCRPT